MRSRQASSSAGSFSDGRAAERGSGAMGFGRGIAACFGFSDGTGG